MWNFLSLSHSNIILHFLLFHFYPLLSGKKNSQLVLYLFFGLFCLPASRSLPPPHTKKARPQHKPLERNQRNRFHLHHHLPSFFLRIFLSPQMRMGRICAQISLFYSCSKYHTVTLAIMPAQTYTHTHTGASRL